MEQKPKIIASTLDDFKKIEEKLNSLPKPTYNIIESAERGLIGIECKIRNSFGDTKIPIPATTQISDFGDFIGIYAHDFFFRIPGEMKKYKLTYVFLDELNKEK